MDCLRHEGPRAVLNDRAATSVSVESGDEMQAEPNSQMSQNEESVKDWFDLDMPATSEFQYGSGDADMVRPYGAQYADRSDVAEPRARYRIKEVEHRFFWKKVAP